MIELAVVATIVLYCIYISAYHHTPKVVSWIPVRGVGVRDINIINKISFIVPPFLIRS